ncbi:hypothetical protein DXA30_02825 [Fusobacterium ulcerans]|uniref:hypothetical protein n=1 Tax=Fusobacterium ulcerans TaxID=861 RepID=UPI000E552E6A|nr:hypothetical protein [Fusobacterium ulcerans]RGY66704.1 hypothetical protein DXA30_02825 [Fusobacterium ulcerans]
MGLERIQELIRIKQNWEEEIEKSIVKEEFLIFEEFSIWEEYETDKKVENLENDLSELVKCVGEELPEEIKKGYSLFELAYSFFNSSFFEMSFLEFMEKINGSKLLLFIKLTIKKYNELSYNKIAVEKNRILLN